MEARRPRPTTLSRHRTVAERSSSARSRRFGTVDAVVHNAGVWRHAFYDEMTSDQLDPVLDVHLRGAFFVTQPAWSIMKEKGYGRIVLTSSGAGAFGREKGTNYVAAKAGILGLGRALALEGAQYGILTNCILPIAPFDRQKPGPPEIVERLVAAGLPPNAGPELVSPMVAYLASRNCTVSGEAFSAGCGRFARVFIGVTEWLAQSRKRGCHRGGRPCAHRRHREPRWLCRTRRSVGRDTRDRTRVFKPSCSRVVARATTRPAPSTASNGCGTRTPSGVRALPGGSLPAS